MRSEHPSGPASPCSLRRHALNGALLTVLQAGLAFAPALAQTKQVADRLPTENQTGFSPDRRQAAAGWVKYAGNPVLGGEPGTCFDVSVLKEAGVFKMWFSWRPKAAVALVESKDGIHWSKPVIVLGPNAATSWGGYIGGELLSLIPENRSPWKIEKASGYCEPLEMVY